MIRTIKRLERLPNTANGNPRYRVIFTDGDQRTTHPDAACAFRITNSEYQDVPVDFTLNKQGEITYAHPVPAEQWQVFRDGMPLSEPLPNENDAETWLLKHQPMSNDWAKKYEGYSIRKVIPGK